MIISSPKSPASLSASSAVTTAIKATFPIVRLTFLVKRSGTSKSLTKAPRDVFNRSYSSSFSQCSTQFLYIFNLSNASFTVEPSGEVIPIPVITTLLTDKALR